MRLKLTTFRKAVLVVAIAVGVMVGNMSWGHERIADEPIDAAHIDAALAVFSDVRLHVTKPGFTDDPIETIFGALSAQPELEAIWQQVLWANGFEANSAGELEWYEIMTDVLAHYRVSNMPSPPRPHEEIIADIRKLPSVPLSETGAERRAVLEEELNASLASGFKFELTEEQRATLDKLIGKGVMP